MKRPCVTTKLVTVYSNQYQTSETVIVPLPSRSIRLKIFRSVSRLRAARQVNALRIPGFSYEHHQISKCWNVGFALTLTAIYCIGIVIESHSQSKYDKIR